MNGKSNRVLKNKKTVFVAMSGGVDSSVAAALLKKQGFEVVGVYMKPWQPKNDDRFCMWKREREEALRAASALGIPFLTWDFSKEYKREVADYMINEYKIGRTPNPDIMCNKEIKFGLFLKRALKEGADHIATGHYVRIKWSRTKGKFQYNLLKAEDKNKDQSYFLWTLTQKQLKYCLFPVGDHKKPDIRKLARKFNLPNADKKDSQGVCFIGELDMKEFLKKYLKPRTGKILDQNKNVIGEHDGVFYYTLGQRHGLDITIGGGPYYIISKNIKNNTLVVGNENELSGKDLRIKNLNLINGTKLPGTFDVRVRYRAKLSKGTLNQNGKLNLLKPEKAITPGQSAVFYDNENLVGGGIIA